MHETSKFLGATETKSNASLSHGVLGELFCHLPNVLFNKVMKVLIVHKSRFNDMLTLCRDCKANGVQENVHTNQRLSSDHWNERLLSDKGRFVSWVNDRVSHHDEV